MFNYFGLFSQDMQWYATFCSGNVVAAKTVIGCGHMVIALNRFTAFYIPLKQEQIWSNTNVYLTVLSLWSISIIATVFLVIIHEDSPRFFKTSDGFLQINGGMLELHGSFQTIASNIMTVILCSITYTCCYLKVRKSKYRHSKVEKRLFLCALVSSVPFLFETARSLTTLFAIRKNKAMYIAMAECCYETEQAQHFEDRAT
ncbi:hypothetical protein Y032_0308g2041 [Ancylostoma ceylanicum]|uniref:Serpentine receptor class gamma n=4 Tax=Ancylostoma ceylanicum TaxID=53326 RepID=A0A016S3E8_9BILA|nr:hypothetical protein Y032_0308g2041 [Ancylostoma ceylanicum]